MENKNKIIFIGGDHASYEAREKIQKFLFNNGFLVYDQGSYNKDPTNYAKYALKVAKGVQNTPNSKGILICGSGIGVNIAANKVKNINSNLVYNTMTANIAKKNNCNVISMGARFLSDKKIEKYVKIFLDINDNIKNN